MFLFFVFEGLEYKQVSNCCLERVKSQGLLEEVFGGREIGE
jgi:hypothetical protein